MEHQLHTTQSKIDSELSDVVEKSFLPSVNDPCKEYIFHTLWLIIEKKTTTIVGALCFHGEPENGMVEIGYGINEDSRNHGFMTEALTGLLEWASNRSDIDSVIAETENANTASIKVLEKCGFKNFETNEDLSVFYFKYKP